MKDELKEKKVEWHYLKENPNDLPKNREKVWLLVKLNDKWNRTELLVGYRDFGDCLGEYCESWGYFEPIKNVYYDFINGEEVIAWKEIVLPDAEDNPEKVFKRIKELEKENAKFFKEQMEKMKCCGNCMRVCPYMSSEWKGCWRDGVPTKWRLKIR